MIQVVFKNLDRSEIAKDIVRERFEDLLDRFPDLQSSRVTVTLAMDNSPRQAGPDVFTVKVRCEGGRYKGVILEKSAGNLYAALADVADHMLERLNRFGDRARVRQRTRARKSKSITA